MGGYRYHRKQKTALEFPVEKSGYRLSMSPKYHPELPGVEMEHLGGKRKLKSRRKMNYENPWKFRVNGQLALSTDDILIVHRCRRCARHARDSRRVYETSNGPGPDKNESAQQGSIEGFALVETMREERHTVISLR